MSPDEHGALAILAVCAIALIIADRRSGGSVPVLVGLLVLVAIAMLWYAVALAMTGELPA